MMKQIVGLVCALAVMAEPMVARAEDVPPDMQGLSQEQVDQTFDFLRRSTNFIMFHETGHLLVSELNLPVLGREEDAVDTLSTVLLLNNTDPELDGAVWAASAAWMMIGDETEAMGGMPPVWDEHSLDKQRGYNIICLMYGQDPNKYLISANAFGLPASRRRRCASEYQQALTSWEAVLKPYQLQEMDPDPYRVTYEVPEREELKPYAEFAVATGFLNLVDKHLRNSFKLEPGIRLTARQCDAENAFWSREQRELTLCYELLPWLAGIYMRKNFNK